MSSTRADGMPMLAGYAVKWNEWTEVNSPEGHFFERFAPGAFDESITRDLGRIRVLFMHGQDSQVGQRPLGSIEVLRDDSIGLAYEVALLDVGYVRELMPALRANQFGASVSFRGQAEDRNSRPPRSARNPDGMPERTVRQARLYEFSVVTFAQYAGATAGLRGFRPWWYLGRRVVHDYLPVAVRSDRPSWDLDALDKRHSRLGKEPWRIETPGWRPH
jgi:HK97 family phage prohead protease